MTNREEVLKFFFEAEKRQKVYLWKYREIDVWPIIKFVLFFTWEKKSSGFEGQKGFTRRTSLIAQFPTILYRLTFLMKFLFQSFKNTDILFFGAPHFNVNEKGETVNKFFFPFKLLNPTLKSIEIEYFDDKRPSLFKSKNKFYLSNFSVWGTIFRKAVKFKDIHQNSELRILIKSFSNLTGIEEKILLNAIKTKLISLETYCAIMRLIFYKVKPKEVRNLCYYNIPMFAVTYISNKNHIQNMDMQHGGIGMDHPMYNYCNLHLKLNTIPSVFGVWDEITETFLKRVFERNSEYKIHLLGNLWIDYLKTKGFQYISTKGKVILYTMQYPILNDFIINAIKNLPDDYIWWLRMHPRYSNNKKELIEVLAQEQLLDRIEFEQANCLSLPHLLDLCDIHISAFSGSIIEASILNVPTVIISPIGKRMYAEYIDAKRAVYFDEKSENLAEIIKRLII